MLLLGHLIAWKQIWIKWGIVATIPVVPNWHTKAVSSHKCKHPLVTYSFGNQCLFPVLLLFPSQQVHNEKTGGILVYDKGEEAYDSQHRSACLQIIFHSRIQRALMLKGSLIQFRSFCLFSCVSDKLRFYIKYLLIVNPSMFFVFIPIWLLRYAPSTVSAKCSYRLWR